MALLVCACKGGKDNTGTDIQTTDSVQLGSGDLAMFGLKGQVKEVKELSYETDAIQSVVRDTIEGATTLFGQDGKLVNTTNDGLTVEKIQRDAEGRITSLFCVYKEYDVTNETQIDVEYDGALMGKAMSVTSGEFSMTTTLTPVYKDGEEVSRKSSSVQDGNIFDEEEIYTVQKRDAKGNWTLRFVKVVATEQLLDENLELQEPVTSERYRIDERIITYYE